MSKSTQIDQTVPLHEGCKGCRKTKEPFSAVLPFSLLESITDRPLRIRGVAMTAGMSRNFTVYIGKSSGDKQHLFQESKFRYISLKRALIAKGILQPPLKPITAAEREALEQIAKKHCTKYVGILWDESKKAHLDSAEKLIVFKKKPDGNATLKKRYRGIKPFKLINKGKESILATLGLETSYEIH